ncbi:MAG: hypothetical protein WA979_11280 [Pacificimonas sp.]
MAIATIRFIFASAATMAIAGSAMAIPVTPFLTDSSRGAGDCRATAVGTPTNCTAVEAERSDIDTINEGVAGFYSLGVGGSLSFNVAPQFIDSSLFAVEVTFGTPSLTYGESARFDFSGPDGTFGSAEISNSGAPFSQTNVIVTQTFNSDSTTYSFLIDSAFNQLVLTDTTFDRYSEDYATRFSDGFDLGELSFDIVDTPPGGQIPIPAPPALALLGLGIGALAIRSRVRK